MSDVTFTDADFDTKVLQSKGLVMVDFFAPWCGPCKMMAPTIAKLATTYAEKMVIGELNVDDNQVTSEKYGIQSIPTIIFFKDGAMVDKMIGFQTEEKLVEKIESLLA